MAHRLQAGRLVSRKEIPMKPIHQQFIAAACFALLGAAAVAQPAQPAVVAPGPAPSTMPGPMAGQHPMMREQFAHRMEQHRAHREAALKQILQITPAQEGAWNQWIAARRPPAGMQRPHRGDFAQLTTPQRLDRMRELRAVRNAEMDRRADATRSFYAALSPAQQKAFDALTASRGFGGREGHHGGWGHHRAG
jgi:periplasmic protein CpxP/Spy